MKKWALILAALFLVSCGKKATDSSSSGSTPAPVPTISYPFELIISTQYDTGGATTLEADCQIATGTAVGTTQACTNTAGAVNTTVAIPEGRLYFSNLTLNVNVGSGSVSNGCEIVIIQPYYYRASSTAGFVGPWMPSGSTGIDCSGAAGAPGADCYGGVAKDMVTGFPDYTANYFLTAQSLSSNMTAKSANLRHHGSNRYAVNNMAGGQRNTTHTWQNGDKYTAPPSAGVINYHDYSFQCLDKYLQIVYAFSLTLTDVDISGVYPNASQGNPAINQRPDWDLTSWDY